MSPLSIVPLFPGVPGGPELLVILLIVVLLLGIPVLLVVLGVAGGVSILGRKDQQVAELEDRVAELEKELEKERDREREGGED